MVLVCFGRALSLSSLQCTCARGVGCLAVQWCLTCAEAKPVDCVGALQELRLCIAEPLGDNPPWDLKNLPRLAGARARAREGGRTHPDPQAW